MGTEKLQCYFSHGSVAVVSCFSSHLAFQWIALSFNKVFSIQIHLCLCWEGDGKRSFFQDVLFDPCLRMEGASVPLRLQPSDQNHPHLLSVFFCNLKFLDWLPEETIPTVWELHRLQLSKTRAVTTCFLSLTASRI